MKIVRVLINDKFNGTAFFINSNTLLTAKHVVDKCKNVAITEIDGGGILPIDDIKLCERDIAILKTKREFNIPNITFFKNIREGMEVKIEGFYDERSSINSFTHTISGYLNTHHTFTLQNYISKGISGSPIYYQDKICGITQARDKDKNITYLIPISEVCINLDKREQRENESDFIKEVFRYLELEKIVVLLSQDFTNIFSYLREIEERGKESSDFFFHFELREKYQNQKEFISHICSIFGIDKEIRGIVELKNTIKNRLEKRRRENKSIFLFIDNFDKCDKRFSKKSAQIIRDLKIEPNFFAILIGRKELASMIYARGELSPLNNTKELFFPETSLEDIDIINRQFMQLSKFQERICKYLKKEDLGIALTWHFNEVIRELFWKNLIIKKSNGFVWKSDFIKKIGMKIFECE